MKFSTFPWWFCHSQRHAAPTTPSQRPFLIWICVLCFCYCGEKNGLCWLGTGSMQGQISCIFIYTKCLLSFLSIFFFNFSVETSQNTRKRTWRSPLQPLNLNNTTWQSSPSPIRGYWGISWCLQDKRTPGIPLIRRYSSQFSMFFPFTFSGLPAPHGCHLAFKVALLCPLEMASPLSSEVISPKGFSVQDAVRLLKKD